MSGERRVATRVAVSGRSMAPSPQSRSGDTLAPMHKPIPQEFHYQLLCEFIKKNALKINHTRHYFISNEEKSKRFSKEEVSAYPTIYSSLFYINASYLLT